MIVAIAVTTQVVLVMNTAIGAIASQKMVPIFGPRMLLIVGGVVAAVGMAWLSRIPVHSEYASSVLGPTLVAGAGMSLMLVPIVTAATIGIDRQHAGLASGLVNMSRQVGGAIGLAILVTVAASESHHGGPSAAAGVVHGYRTVLVITAAVSLASVILTALLPAKPKRVPPSPATESAP